MSKKRAAPMVIMYFHYGAKAKMLIWIMSNERTEKSFVLTRFAEATASPAAEGNVGLAKVFMRFLVNDSWKS